MPRLRGGPRASAGRRRLVTAAGILLCLAGVQAQTPYAVQIAGLPIGSGDDLVKATTTDLFGNTYIVGDFRSPTLSIAGTRLTNLAAGASTTTGVTSDIYVAKFNWKGELEWAQRWGGPLDELAADVVVENKNVYVVGSFKSQVFTIGGTAATDLTNPPRGRANVEIPYVTFMVKLDGTGKVLWTSDLGDGQAVSLAVDPAQGLVYAAGAYHGDGGGSDDDGYDDDDDIKLGKTGGGGGGGALSYLGSAGTQAADDDDYDDDLANPGFLDAYVTCLSSATGVSYGSVLISGEKDEYPTDLATDPSRKSLIMAGVFESPSLNIGDMGTLKLDASGGPAGYIVKMDSVRAVGWVEWVGWVGGGRKRGVEEEEREEGHGSLTAHSPTQSHPTFLQATGDIQWSKSVGKITSVLVRVAVDTNSVYVTGQFNQPAITSLNNGQSPSLIRMELSTGRVTWAKALPKVTHVALDFLGYAYLGGTYTNAIALASNVSLPAATATTGDLYMVKVHTRAGQVVLAKTFPSGSRTGTYGVSDIAVDSAKNVYLAGTYNAGNLVMDDKTLPSPGAKVDGFMGRVLVQGTFPASIRNAVNTMAPTLPPTTPRPTTAAVATPAPTDVRVRPTPPPMQATEAPLTTLATEETTASSPPLTTQEAASPNPSPAPTPLPSNAAEETAASAPEVADDLDQEVGILEFIGVNEDDSGTEETITEDTELLSSYDEPGEMGSYGEESPEVMGVIDGDWTPPPVTPVVKPLDKTALKSFPTAKTGIRLFVNYAGRPSTVKFFQTSLFNAIKPYCKSLVSFSL